MSSRAITDMTDKMVILYQKFESAMRAASIPFIVTCTARTYQEQVALYAQGRQGLAEVNALRKVARLAPITATDNRRQVTWTLASRHIINLYDGLADNDKARAFDIVLTAGGKATWDVKADINKNNISDYTEAGKIGESVGLVWGGRFSKQDLCHFEEPKTV